jgi:hypothetical protein
MTISRRTLNSSALLLALTATAGCVSTSVTSRAITTSSPPAQSLLVIVKGGKFSAGNVASNLGQKNLDSLVPSLVRRLPIVFSANGLPTRAQDAYVSDAALHASLKPVPPERILILSPTSATYNSKSGQELFLNAQLLDDSGLKALVWQAQIRMGTMGFGSFDDKVADDIGLQLLEKLRTDRVAVVAGGTLRVE